MAGIAAATYRYRGREITAADILYIGELIAAQPGREPPHTFEEAMRGMGLATAQRRFARHGVPGDAADVGPCGPDRVAAGKLRAA